MMMDLNNLLCKSVKECKKFVNCFDNNTICISRKQDPSNDAILADIPWEIRANNNKHKKKTKAITKKTLFYLVENCV